MDTKSKNEQELEETLHKIYEMEMQAYMLTSQDPYNFDPTSINSVISHYQERVWVLRKLIELEKNILKQAEG